MKIVKIGRGSGMVLVVSVLFALTVLQTFEYNRVIQSTVSPNGRYAAKLWDSNQGVLGGETWIDFTRQPGSYNLLFAELQRHPNRVYIGLQGEWNRMTLHWRADDLLHVDFDTPFTFRFDGRRWIRE